MQSVQIRVDVGGADMVPHTFLSVIDPSGTRTEYGFVPAIPGQLVSPGKIEVTVKRETDAETPVIPFRCVRASCAFKLKLWQPPT